MPQILPFPQIVDRLPEASWYRNHADEFPQSLVLLLEGGSRVAELDLDAVLGIREDARQQDEAGWHQQKNILLVLVVGNLTVTGAVYNADTDGSGAGLVVLGDLSAGSMLVGGQQIFVCGNLDVSGLFWGDYNHGWLNVGGRATAQFWLATDQYRYDVGGGITAGALWDDDSCDALPPHPCHATLLPWFPKELILPDCAPEDSLNHWLRREQFIDASRRGKPVLVPRQSKLSRPPRVASDAIALENLQSLLQTPLREGPPCKNLPQWGARPFVRLGFPREDFLGGIYFETGSGRYFLTIELQESSLLGRLVGSRTQSGAHCGVRGRRR